MDVLPHSSVYPRGAARRLHRTPVTGTSPSLQRCLPLPIQIGQQNLLAPVPEIPELRPLPWPVCIGWLLGSAPATGSDQTGRHIC
jgi:hypothetical protein